MCASAVAQCVQTSIVSCAATMCTSECLGDSGVTLGDATAPDGGSAACAKVAPCCSLLSALGSMAPATPAQCTMAAQTGNDQVCTMILSEFQAVGVCK
jgi:hypothetical protein